MSNQRGSNLIFLFLSLTLQFVSIAQEDGGPVILNHADSLVGLEINGERARELIGNVKFTQGSTVVTCSRAIQYLESNRIALEGVVEVHDDSMRLVTERGMYYPDTRTAEAFNRVMLEDQLTVLRAAYGKYFAKERRAFFTQRVSVSDTGSVLYADTLTYFRTQQHLVADGNVKIENFRNLITTYGGHFENFRDRKYSSVSGSPRVEQVDTAGGAHDTLVIHSNFMESYQDSIPRLIATDSVRIFRSELAARAGLAIMFTRADSIILKQSPVIWYTTEGREEHQISGDSVFIELRERKVHQVHVRGHAVAVSRADSVLSNRFNQMSGQEIILQFADNKLSQIDVDRTATSLYYLFDDDKPNGINRSTGDHITITFVEGRIGKLKVGKGAEGQYFPERMIRGKESEYNLDGFVWREDKPRREVKK